MVVDDTVQRDQSVVEDQAEPKVAVESLESSRKLSAPDATSNAELPVSTSGLQMPNSDIADSDTIFTVQLGTFLDRVKAQEFYDRASSVLGIKGSIQGDWPFFRLRFGEFLTRTSADSLHRVAMSCGFYDARVLKTTPSQ